MIDAIVVDSDDPEPVSAELTTLACPTLMKGRRGRRKLAERVLELGREL